MQEIWLILSGLQEAGYYQRSSPIAHYTLFAAFKRHAYLTSHSFHSSEMHGLLGHFILSRDEDDGASRGQQAVVVTGVLTGLAILIVAMRLFARIGLMKLRGREDYAIVVALVSEDLAFRLQSTTDWDC